MPDRPNAFVSIGPWSVGELVRAYAGLASPSSFERIVRRVVAPEHATSDDDLVVVTSIKGARRAESVRGVILCQRDVAHRVPRADWTHEHALWVVARLVRDTVRGSACAGVEAGAWVDPDATVHSTARIRRGAVVRADAFVDRDADIGEGAIIYGGAHIGERVIVGPNAVIGRPGFGFATGPNGALERMPHLGGAIVEADVEIGALCTIDAGTLAPTIVRRGTKLDAHVHVAHNVDIGENSFVAAQSGFAGSSRLGAGVLVGGQAGVKDHAVVGDGAHIGAKSGVIGDIPPGAVVVGFPAIPRFTWLRVWAKLSNAKRRESDE